jgi:hypothetical protein
VLNGTVADKQVVAEFLRCLADGKGDGCCKAGAVDRQLNLIHKTVLLQGLGAVVVTGMHCGLRVVYVQFGHNICALHGVQVRHCKHMLRHIACCSGCQHADCSWSAIWLSILATSPHYAEVL